MRVATAAQMAAIDCETIDGGVPGLELMERAGREMVHAMFELLPDLPHGTPVAVLCGKGNNGGDGLVVARLLTELGFEVTVMLLAAPVDLAPDARANFDRLGEEIEVLTPLREQWAAEASRLCAENSVVVDAVFGTGIQPPVREDYAALFAAVDQRLTKVVSLDIPSGVDGRDGGIDPIAVRAHATVTVGLPKLGLLLQPGRDHAGLIAVVDIGFEDEICERHTDDLHYLLPADLADLLPTRPPDVHKYEVGCCLVMAGSSRFGGAALLAATGALRSGAGMVTLALPSEHVGAALSYAPEALVTGLATGDGGCLTPLASEDLNALLNRQDAWALGPGLGDDQATDLWLIEVLARETRPVVLDADALSAFARQGREFACAAAQTIITPHAGELARLADVSPRDLQEHRLEIVGESAKRWGCVLVAKGAPTLIAAPDGAIVINASGDDSLAHGGTGDVLTGLLGGLLAQKIPAMDAALLGCWLHGRAGELAGWDGSRRAVTAGDVAAALPRAYAELTSYRVSETTS